MKKVLIMLMLACIALWAIESDPDVVDHPNLTTHTPDTPPVDSVLGAVVYEMNAETATTPDNQLLGIEFDGTYFYVTGGGGTTGGRPNSVYVIDTLGNLVWMMDQGTSSAWGWRDIAWDGVYTGADRIDTLYASDNINVTKFGIDLLTGTLTNYGTFRGPSNPNRALAYHQDSAWFFTASFRSDCWKFSKTNSNIQQVSNPWAHYGAAWDSDPSDGGWIWWHSQDDPGTGFTCQIEQMDPISMAYTGVDFGFTPSLITTGMAGGLSFYEGFRDTMDVLFAMIQGDPTDIIVGLYVRSHDMGSQEHPVVGTPLAFGFAPNMANPIRTPAPITYTTTHSGKVSLKVYDGTGKHIETLVNVVQPAGAKTINWDIKNIANGVYFFKLEADGQSASHKLVLIQ